MLSENCHSERSEESHPIKRGDPSSSFLVLRVCEFITDLINKLLSDRTIIDNCLPKSRAVTYLTVILPSIQAIFIPFQLLRSD